MPLFPKTPDAVHFTAETNQARSERAANALKDLMLQQYADALTKIAEAEIDMRLGVQSVTYYRDKVQELRQIALDALVFLVKPEGEN